MKNKLIKELKKYKLNIDKAIRIVEQLEVEITSYTISNTTNSIYINGNIRISDHHSKNDYINIDFTEFNNIKDINTIIKKSQNWTREQWDKFNDYSCGISDFINKVEDDMMEIYVKDIEEMLFI